MNNVINLDEIKMKNLLIVGNGFDIDLKLPTKYIDFRYFIECLSETNWMEFQKKYLEKNVEKEVSKDKEMYEKMYLEFSKYENNFFVLYFLEFVNVDCSWIDIEKEIERIIKALDRYFYYFSFTESKKEKKIICFPCEDYSKMLNANEDEYVNVLNDIFKKIRKCNLYDVVGKTINFKYNNAIDCVRSNFGGITADNIDNDFKSKFVYYLLNELIAFEDLFSKYLNVCLPKDVNKDKFIKNIQQISRFDSSITINNNYKIISYNYTKYIKGVFNRQSVDYIHGEANFDKGWDGVNENIIFGIDSEVSDALKNKKYNIFSKRNRRVYHNTRYSRINETLTKISNIIIFGHSLSFSDDDSLKFIIGKIVESFEFLFGKEYIDLQIRMNSGQKKISPIRNYREETPFKIIVFYHNDEARADLINNLSRIIGKEEFDKLFVEERIVFIETLKDKVL